MSIWLFLFALFFSPAQAQDLPSCETPQQAADTLLALLQPDNYHPDRAASCMNLAGVDAGDGPALAVQLKQVLDASGHYIQVQELPGPGDEIPGGTKSFALVEQLPSVYLERVGERWLWSADTVQAIPELYSRTFSGFGSMVKRRLPPSFQKPFIGQVQPWQLVLFAALTAAALLGALLVNLVLRSWLHKLVVSRGIQLDYAPFDRTRAPMRLVVFGAIFLIGVPELALPVQASVVLLFLARVLVSAGVVVIALRWTDVFASIFAARAAGTDTRMDDQVVPLVARLAKLSVAALGIVFVLSNLGIDVGSLVAGLGVGGIAIAFGAQDTVANLFGSVTIFTDQPFQVGDWVKIGGVEGAVEEVGFRSTRIRDVSSSLISVPNRTVASSEVDNMGKRTHRRVSTSLGVSYGTPRPRLLAFMEGVRAVLEEHPDSLPDPLVVFSGFGDSSLDILVIFNLSVLDYGGFIKSRSQVFLSIMHLAEALEVSFAFPSQSIYVESLPGQGQAPAESLSPEQLRARVQSVLHKAEPG